MAVVMVAPRSQKMVMINKVNPPGIPLSHA
jgi:hypothetical protein